MAKKLNLRSTKDFADSKVSLLLYGAPGAGKTTFAASWPNPVFFVPQSAETEMHALTHMDLPVVGFDSLEGMSDQVKALGKAIEAGDILCDTLVIDNLTAIQLMLQQDLKNTSGKVKLEFDEWSIYTDAFQKLLLEMHKLPPHIIWIAHSEITFVEDKAYGDIFMSGKAVKKLFKAFPSMMLEAVCLDLKAAGRRYSVCLKSHGIWECKIRGDGEKIAKFPDKIDSDYNELAALMGWASREDIEGYEEGGEAKKAKKKKQKK